VHVNRRFFYHENAQIGNYKSENDTLNFLITGLTLNRVFAKLDRFNNIR
jgi:hypothetical protein